MAWRAGLHGTAVTPMSQWVTSEDLTGNGTDGPGYCLDARGVDQYDSNQGREAI
jgi:hypothetical protein